MSFQIEGNELVKTGPKKQGHFSAPKEYALKTDFEGFKEHVLDKLSIHMKEVLEEMVENKSAIDAIDQFSQQVSSEVSEKHHNFTENVAAIFKDVKNEVEAMKTEVKSQIETSEATFGQKVKFLSADVETLKVHVESISRDLEAAKRSEELAFASLQAAIFEMKQEHIKSQEKLVKAIIGGAVAIVLIAGLLAKFI